MKAYIFENNYTIAFYKDLQEAKEDYEHAWNRLRNYEKSRFSYFRLYEIEYQDNDELNKTADLMDLCTKVISQEI